MAYGASIYLDFVLGWGVLDNAVFVCVNEEWRIHYWRLLVIYSVASLVTGSFTVLFRYLWMSWRKPFECGRTFDKVNAFFLMVCAWGVCDWLVYVVCYLDDWWFGLQVVAWYAAFGLPFLVGYLLRRFACGSRYIVRDIFALMEEAD